MKKVILAFDGINFSQGAFDFARRLNELDPILLVGSFIPEPEDSPGWGYAVSITKPVADTSIEIIEANIKSFKSQCRIHRIEYHVHKYHFDLAIPELGKESRFADLVILGSESFYHQLGVEKPNEYLRMVLQGAECPVIVTPEHFPFPQSVVLAYDGSEDAVFAIKQFACLFPFFATMDTTLVYATEKKMLTRPI